LESQRQSTVSPRPQRATRTLRIGLATLWLAAVLVGFWHLGTYASVAGPSGSPPGTWPAQSGIARRAGAPALLVFAHPQCPCSRASISELARLMVRARDPLSAHVIVYRPSSEPIAWAQGHNWRSAAAIPGVRVSADVDGIESKRFGVNVSGHTLVYDRQGFLVFSGGITAARGHEGGNDGRLAIESFLLKRAMTISHTPVFGCFLRPAETS
jgi:hypothetical protein